ncbi:MAG TPA: hypothetical protein VLK82_08480 [Candidatus Tectomicrobia bacterium]|nr:hypothetical protein [Candidatus Tectomicrobia bacterium]
MARSVLSGLALIMIVAAYLFAPAADAVPAFARQYDLQCNACHTRPPRLNSFGEQVHMMGFQIPSAARPGGLIQSLKEDGVGKTLIDSLALRILGNIFEYSTSPEVDEKKLEPPHEFELFIARPLSPNLSMFVEVEYEPKGVEFEDGRFKNKGVIGLGNEAFVMANLGRLLGFLGAPTMEMGGQTMVGRHGGFQLHGPMLMGGKIDPSTNFSYPTNRQLFLDTETEVHDGEVERFPVVPYAFSSKFFGLFKNRAKGEPLLATDQVMYNTPGRPGADFHTMFMHSRFPGQFVLGQVGFLQENEGFNTYLMGRYDFGQRDQFTFNMSALVNWGFGVAKPPDPDDEDHPGVGSLNRLRYGFAANGRWKALDVYGSVIWDHVFNLPGPLKSEFDRTATGLSVQVDYLILEPIMLSTRFDQLWAGGLRDEKRDGTVWSFQVRYYPWPNISFFARDSYNLRAFVHDNPLRSWRNQFFVGIDWDW